MNEVKLSIGDRDYTVACAPGEEAHVSALGEVIDAKVKQLGSNSTKVEAQKLLFSALFLADELHEAKKAINSAETARTEALRDANLAVGTRDQLQLTISGLESELEGLQSAQQQHSAEVNEIRTELTQRREESEECRSELEKSAARVAELERESAELASQLEDARNIPTPSPSPEGLHASLIDNPDLAPALERFADLLETCADKLEAGTAST